MAPLKKKRIQIRKFPVTQYQADALKQLCPPENITVSEWAENYRVLDSKTSALPGPWRNDKTPYLKEIMDELINYDTERIIFVKPTQSEEPKPFRTCSDTLSSRIHPRP
mgnify:CR=1 FL=1